MNYKELTTKELKHIRHYTISFTTLEAVERELINRKKLKQTSTEALGSIFGRKVIK